MTLALRPAEDPPDLQAIRDLFREYAHDLGEDLDATQDFAHEFATLPGPYAPPAGRLLLATADHHPAGCVALKHLSPGVCEMKRLYVRPQYRTLGLGRRLAEQILHDARTLGYHTLRLDTLARLTPALSLYRSLGFTPIPPYWPNPLPGVEYMELRL